MSALQFCYAVLSALLFLFILKLFFCQVLLYFYGNPKEEKSSSEIFEWVVRPPTIDSFIDILYQSIKPHLK